MKKTPQWMLPHLPTLATNIKQSSECLSAGFNCATAKFADGSDDIIEIAMLATSPSRIFLQWYRNLF